MGKCTASNVATATGINGRGAESVHSGGRMNEIPATQEEAELRARLAEAVDEWPDRFTAATDLPVNYHAAAVAPPNRLPFVGTVTADGSVKFHPVNPVGRLAECDYPTDEQWEKVETLLPPQRRRGRRRDTDLRLVVALIRYRRRTGCQWRAIPK